MDTMTGYEEWVEIPDAPSPCSGVLSGESCAEQDEILAPGTPPVPKDERPWVLLVQISDLEDKLRRKKAKIDAEQQWSDRLAQQNSRLVGESRDLRADLKRTREELEKIQALSTERGQWIATVMESGEILRRRVNLIN